MLRDLCAEPYGGANEKPVLPFHRSAGGDQTQLPEPIDREPLGASFNGYLVGPAGADAGWLTEKTKFPIGLRPVIVADSSSVCRITRPKKPDRSAHKRLKIRLVIVGFEPHQAAAFSVSR